MARKPAQERAMRGLLSAIEGAKRTGAQFLPPAPTLALRAGVSTRIMWQVARELVRCGVLTSRGRLGLRINTAISVAAEPVQESGPADTFPREAWKRARDAVRKQTYGGRFRDTGVLPSVKQLCQEQGTSYPTMRRALNALVQERLIEPHGSRLRTRVSFSRTAGQRIVLVTRRLREEASGAVPFRQTQDLLAVEGECSRLGLHLSYVRLGYQEKIICVVEDNDGVMSLPPDALPALGFLILAGFTEWRGWSDIWDRIDRSGKPVAFISPFADPPSVDSRRRNAPVAIVRTADNADAGVAMAQYLLAKGHSRVAYLSLSSNPWEAERLDGMRREFGRAGYPDAVEAFEPEPAAQQLSGRKPLQDPLEVRVAGEIADRIRAESNPFVREIWAYLNGSLVSASQTALLRIIAQSVCERAFDRGRATVWVCTNDAMALHCLAWLEQRKSKRRDISMAGFDNTLDASRAGLTSYDFGSADAVRRAIEFILRPGSSGGHAKGFREIRAEGRMMERRSVYRPAANRAA